MFNILKVMLVFLKIYVYHKNKRRINMKNNNFPTVDEIKAILPKRLKYFRDQKDLSLREAADIIGKSPALISLWEKGRNFPTFIDVFNICLAYNIEPLDLVTVETQKNIEPNKQELELIRKYRNSDYEVKITIRKVLECAQIKNAD